MDRKILVIIFLSLSLYGHSQQNKSLLLSAYQSNSKSKADSFFLKWETETLALIQKNDNESNDTLIHLRNVFKCVFDSILSSNKNISNAGIYFVIQNKIEYEFTDTTNKNLFLENTPLFTADGKQKYLPNNNIYQLQNFIPKIDISSKRWLLNEQKYDNLIGHFLGNKKHFNYKEQNEGKTPLIIFKSKSESEKRLNFLSKYLKLPDNNDFTNKWNLCSNPNISRIIFKSGFSKAWVDINFGVMGGLAFLENSSNGWVLKEIKITWIE